MLRLTSVNAPGVPSDFTFFNPRIEDGLSCAEFSGAADDLIPKDDIGVGERDRCVIALACFSASCANKIT